MVIRLISLISLSLILLVNSAFAESYVEGEVIVKYKDGFAATRSLAINSRSVLAARTMPEYISDSTYLIKTNDNVTNSIEDIMLYNNGDIEYVQPNFIVRALKLPNDKLLYDDDAMKTPRYQYDGKHGVNAPAAWDNNITDSGDLIIAVVDTGIRLDHEDLALNVINNGFDSFRTQATNSGIGHGNDTNGHGTHVAGIIGARGNNGIGIAGVLWQTKLIPVRVLNSKGEGTTKTIVQGIEYAIANNAKVINASYGGDVGGFAITEYNVVKKAIDNGIVVVAAAGNDTKNTDLDPEYPAAYGIRGLISVGASDANSSLTIYRDGSTSCYGQATVHLFAPGQTIVSTYNAQNNSYVVSSGTSMSAPFVTGAVAMLLTKSPQLKPWEVEMILINSVRNVDKLKNYSMSSGILDLNAMLNFDQTKLFEPPKNLTYQIGTSSNSVHITWIGGKGVTEIYTREEGEKFKLLTTVSDGQRSYTHELDQSARGQRYYRIRSKSDGVYSPYVRKDIFNSATNSFVPEHINIGAVGGSVKTANVSGCTVSDNPDVTLSMLILMIILRSVFIRRRLDR